MEFLKYFVWNTVETLLRFVPIPCRTGWFSMGNPSPESPVFLTGNYHLTVLRVKWALRKMDAHLLVADSHGINVWCASTGGHLTSHDVISVLKTSGIESRVKHRRVFLPQLAAAGVEKKTIQKKTGWNVIWGPVDADEIPAFLEAAEEEKKPMRSIRFPLVQRLEMAAAWAFSITVCLFPFWLIFWKEKISGLIVLVWFVSCLTFVLFPTWEKFQHRRLGRLVSSLVLTGIFFCGLVAALHIFGNPSLRNHLFWGGVLLVLEFVLLVDLPGSTPVLKSGFHEEKNHRISVDSERCKGDAICEQVCPCGCFVVDRRIRTATLPGLDRCVQCGACIVQCLFDALAFEDRKGTRIDPQLIRNNKLDLSGKRHLSCSKKTEN